MEENNINTESTSNGFDGFYLSALIFKNKIFVIIFTLIVTIASVIIALSLPNKYTATVNAVPPKNQADVLKGAMGSISSALKEFGMTKLGGGSGEGYDFTVIMFSRTLRDSVIEKFDLPRRYELPDTQMTLVHNELMGNMEISYEKDGNYTIAITDVSPDTAAQMANYIVDFSNRFSQKIFHTEAEFNRKYLESRIEIIDRRVREIADSLQVYSKKYFLFSPEDQATAMSQTYADLKAELIKQETALVMMQNKFGEGDVLVARQKALLVNLREKIHEVETKPGFAGRYALNDAMEIGVEYMRLYAELETFTKVKDFLLPMYEDAKLDEIRNTMSLVVVDPAIPPDRKSAPLRSLIVAGSGFGGFVLSVILLLLGRSWKEFKIKYNKIVSAESK